MISKRLLNNPQDTSDLKTIFFHELYPFDEENRDPKPNIINAAELNMGLLPPTTTRNKRTSTTTKRMESTVQPHDLTKRKEFIAQQKKKLLDKKAVDGCNTSEIRKDDIKKRLAVLHKNSLRIVNRNVAKKHKDIITMANSTKNVDEGIDRNPVAINEAINGVSNEPPTPVPIADSGPAKDTDFKETPTTKSFEVQITVTPRKRGILRRNEQFEGSPYNESKPHLDKTIMDSLLQTVRQRKSVSRKSNNRESLVYNHFVTTPPAVNDDMKLNIPQNELKSSLASRNSSRFRSKSRNTVRISTSSNIRPDSIRSRSEAKINMPYWLKPSSAHAYPYNFIMAVRKKLESVTQPMLLDPVARPDTPVARPKLGRKFNPSNFRENLDKSEDVAHESSRAFLDMIDSIPPINGIKEPFFATLSDEKLKTNEVRESKQVFSESEEFSTNFSSISLHITDRNTMSELSSIRSEHPNHSLCLSKNDQGLSDGQDDTTISSAILSQASPQKKSKRRALFVESLFTEGIDDLKISVHSNSSLKPSSRLHPFINTQRGDVTPPQIDNQLLLPTDLDKRTMVEMFESFSKNLSQVISVNERLHTALTRQSNLSIREISSEIQKGVSASYENLNMSSNTVPNEKTDSVADKTETEQAYTISFEVTNDRIPEETINSVTKIGTYYQRSTNEVSEFEIKELSSTKTVSEQQPPSALVATTDTETVTSRKIKIVAANESARSIDPEFRRFSDASYIIGSDMFAIFSQSDEENSLRPLNQTEDTFNYSSIGMFDQLINNEKQKSEHLSKLMKIREKSLIDRTKGQIAWLELQKKKYKEKGLTDRISAVRKRQRALLMHMAAERANILRLSKLQQSPKSQNSSSKFKFQNFSAADLNVKRLSVGNEMHGISQRSALRAYEIDGTNGLEKILRKREEELQNRRNHVEHLIKWHQRLNREENDLMEVERMLMMYTSAFAIDHPNRSNSSNDVPEDSLSRSPRKIPREVKKIEKIEKSLKLLHDMSSTTCVTKAGEEIEDVVEASGKRLNKLWCRLTGEDVDKFSNKKQYKLSKSDLEKMYEDAKDVVINKFYKHRNIGTLMDNSQSQSMLLVSDDENRQESNLTQEATDENRHNSVIPLLNLNFSQESNTESIERPESNQGITKSNDCFYFSDAELKKTPEKDIPKTITVIVDSESAIESNQDNTQADSISFDNNSSFNQNSINEIIEDISFPNLQDVTSIEHSIPNNTDEHQTANDYIITKSQTISPSDVIISDNVVMAQEFEQDNTTDKSLQLQQSSDESRCITESNQTMLSSCSEENIDEGSDSCQQSSNSKEMKSIDLEQRLIYLDGSLKELSETIDRAPVMEINCEAHCSNVSGGNGVYVNGESSRSVEEDKNDLNEVKMVRNKIINETFPTSDMISVTKHDELFHSSGKSGSLIRDYVSPAGELKMPDIISEAEVLRRHQLQIKQEIKHLDHAVPVVFLREIPNKPPPPYVPPAHGSPMATISPTNERIKEIVYRRISELYNTHISDTPSATEKSHSILAENITNVYERIILDVCKECIIELEIDPSTNYSVKYKQPLAFYNPPNRLEYVQELALNKVKKLLYPNTSCLGRSSQISVCVKRKRDLVDEMLVTEMMEDESEWCNFDLEEKEVIENIVEQLVLIIVNQAVDDAVFLRQSKSSVLKKNERN